MQRVVFTGGECFLLGRDLDSLVSHAHGIGFSTRVISNAYWAVTDAGALKRLSTLKEAGLDEVMLSTGTFHQRFVPVERVIAGARAAVHLGIPTRISVESCEQSIFDASVLHAALKAEIATGLLCIAFSPWIEDAGGRGSESLSHSRDDVISADAMARMRCPQVLTVLTVTPDQMLNACCGFPMESLDDLKIGSVAVTPLDEVVNTAPSSLFTMWMHTNGPAAIAAFVARYVPGFELPSTVSICEACTVLQRDPIAMRVVAERAPEVVDAVVAEFVRMQSPNFATAALSGSPA